MDMGERHLRIVPFILFFAFAGPPFGGAVYMLWWPPGFVPALMTGLLVPVVWALSPKSLRRHFVYRIVTGGLAGAVNMYLVTLLHLKKIMMGETFLDYVLCSAISAAICSAIAGRWLVVDDAQASRPASKGLPQVPALMHQGADITGRRCWDWNIIVFIIFFVSAGPPLGGMVLDLIPFSGFDRLLSKLGNALGAMLFSYVFGFVPALVTGILTSIIWALSPKPLRRHFVYRIVTSGLIGAISSYFLGLFLFKDSFFFRENMFVEALFIVPCGAISAVICAAIAGRWLDDAQSSGRRQRPVTNTDFDVSGGQA